MLNPISDQPIFNTIGPLYSERRQASKRYLPSDAQQSHWHVALDLRGTLSSAPTNVTLLGVYAHSSIVCGQGEVIVTLAAGFAGAVEALPWATSLLSFLSWGIVRMTVYFEELSSQMPKSFPLASLIIKGRLGALNRWGVAGGRCSNEVSIALLLASGLNFRVHAVPKVFQIDVKFYLTQLPGPSGMAPAALKLAQKRTA